jgi:hypothetical protein
VRKFCETKVSRWLNAKWNPYLRLSDLELQIRSTTSQVHATRYTSVLTWPSDSRPVYHLPSANSTWLVTVTQRDSLRRITRFSITNHESQVTNFEFWVIERPIKSRQKCNEKVTFDHVWTRPWKRARKTLIWAWVSAVPSSQEGVTRSFPFGQTTHLDLVCYGWQAMGPQMWFD